MIFVFFYSSFLIQVTEELDCKVLYKPYSFCMKLKIGFSIIGKKKCRKYDEQKSVTEIALQK